jgi:hypothetical protein
MLPRILNASLLSLLGTTVSAIPETVQAMCTRPLLEEVTDRYISAQSTGQLAWLNNVLGPSVTYFENEVALDMKNSTLHRALKIDRSRSIYDLVQCATYTELIVSNPSDPWVIGAQIRLTNNKVSMIDRIVTTTGDWMFNATRTLHYALLEDWSSIPEKQRDTREVLKAAADAYFDMLGNHSLPVPWGYPCTRLEGGAYTGKGLANDTCNIDIPENSTMQAPKRRYVIDETVGVVDMMLEFGGISNAPDSHEFRIENGKLRRIHALTFCAQKPNCGVNMTLPAEDPGY